jgi:hypothetical protein
MQFRVIGSVLEQAIDFAAAHLMPRGHVQPDGQHPVSWNLSFLEYCRLASVVYAIF